MASGYHQQELSPGGCSHAIFLNLHYHSPAPSKTQQAYQHRGSLRTQLVTARDDVLSIYDVYQRPHSSLPSISTAKGHASSSSSDTNLLPRHKLVLARRHNLFGTVTGLQCVQTLTSDKDGRDRLLVSLSDAKLALLEWNDATDDLETVSIHTYERAPQLLNGTPHLFQPNLNVDPLSRCAALLLPHDALAILPFYRDAAEFDFDQDLHFDHLAKDDAAAVAAAAAAAAEMQSLPYSPSFVLTMREVDAKIRNMKDFCFLPGFQKPTVAVLFSHSPSWTGLLAERKDTFSVYLFTLDLSASLDGATLGGSTGDAFDDGTVRSAHPVVTTSSQLPMDCLYMLPCPQTLGGVLVVCMSSILHVDQSGRVVVTALNHWFNTMSSIEPESTLDLPGVADLQGSQLVFTSDTEGVFTLVNGDIYRFRCQMDGRSVEGIRLERMEQSYEEPEEELAPATASPASCLAVSTQGSGNGTEYLFTASMAGDSTLYNLIPVKKALEAEEPDADEAKAESAANDMDLDLDDDLYGTSDVLNGGNSAKNKGASKDKTIVTIRKQDEIRSHGGLHSIARRKLTEHEPGSSKRYGLVGACGSGNQVGLVYMEPRLVPQQRKQVVSAAASGSDSSSFTKVFVVGKDASGSIRMIGSNSDEDSSIAFTCPSEVNGQEQAKWTDVVQLSRGATICADTLLDSNLVARVTTTALQVLSLPSLEIVHETTLANVQQASLDASQYAVIHTSDGDTLLYEYHVSQRRFEAVDVTTALSGGPVISANVFRDTFGHLKGALRSSATSKSEDIAAADAKKISAARGLSSLPNDDEEVDYGEDDDDESPLPTHPNGTGGSSNATTAAAPAYLFALDSDNICRIFTLPDLGLIWQNASLAAQPQRLRYETRAHTELAPEQVAVMSSAVACHIGDMLSIVSLTSDHFLAVYKSNTWATLMEANGQEKDEEGEVAMGLTFNKVFVQLLAAAAGGARFNASGGGRVNGVLLEPFAIPITDERRQKEEAEMVVKNAMAVLGGGREVQASVLCWTEQGGYRLLDWAEGDLSSLSSFTGFPSSAEYAYTDRTGDLYLAKLPSGLYTSTTWMSSIIRTGRTYTKVISHDPTSTVIAASLQPHRFILFDEDGEPLPSRVTDHDTLEDALPTISHRGALELFINEDRTTPVDGYEFEPNETVSSLTIVTLDAPSTVSGRKQFIAAGTTTFHGEDRTSKGSVYLFEVIEVVSSSKYQLGRDLRIKLVCRDDSRAPVTAIADLNGFLVSTCGQKLNVRALEKEEWLISIAFLDCPFYITSVKVVKNFILLSDAQKSLWFLAFQEEPYRFIDLGREVNDYNATLGEVLVHGERMSLVSTSGHAVGGGISGFGTSSGVIRLYEYAPHLPASAGGHRLVLRTEYQTASPVVGSTMCRGKWLSDSELRGREEGRNKLMLAKANGGVESLAAVDEKVLKRLHLLQGQLVRSVMHTAALNPRAYRAVRNDFVSRALNKGVLDGRLLECFLWLSRPKMLEAVRTLGGLFDGLDQVKSENGAKRKRNLGGGEVKGKKVRVKMESQDQSQDAEKIENQVKQEDKIDEQVQEEIVQEQEQEQEQEVDFAKQEQLRLQSEHKRVQLLLKDLLRLRLGFEQV
ncbi:related to cleavage and polyadenylation specificity factor, 160 kDa subunit [Ustilago trichophora]|uniref:Related to cleavage and polyadenylation specificity factor, 160 kDa subunit n=1 Tax=Ustilago trichophora TaxID=86804 RepID=A0A5C3E3H4_9BASI|nr:related to cleavage and polyadenylation specificity factor, 160 kDa subunit [Ustilago trichophora]